MRLARFLLACLVLAVPTSFAAEISLLKGGSVKGDIVSISEKEVVYEIAGAKKTLPITDVLKIDYTDPGRPPAAAKYAQVEIVDGSLLLASDIAIKDTQVELKLLAGPTINLPLASVSNVLMPGHDEKFREEWKSRVFNTRGRDAFVINRKGVLSNVDCTFGKGGKDGTTIDAAVVFDDETIVSTRKIKEDHGYIFKHVLDPKSPPSICKLYNTTGDFILVSRVSAVAEGGIAVETPAGVKLSLSKPQIARLDYAPGKLDYLSDLAPTKLIARSNLDEDDKPDQWHVYKDTNLNKGKLTLGGVVYPKGLALKPFTQLTWDLKGNYRDLSFMVGLDDNVSASGASILLIEGDGKEITQITLDSADKVRFKPVKLNIKDVRELKITVKSADLFDTSRHLDLADLKVSK